MNEHHDGSDETGAAERLADALDGDGTAADGRPVAAEDAVLVALATAIAALPPLEASRRAEVDAAVGVPPAAPPLPGGDPATAPFRSGNTGDDTATGLARPGRALLLLALVGGALWTALGPRDAGESPAAVATDPPARATAAVQATTVARRATPDGLVVTRPDGAASATNGPTAAVTGPRAVARTEATLPPAVEPTAGARTERPTGPPVRTAAIVADPPDRRTATPTPVPAPSPSAPSPAPPVGQAPCGADAPVRGVDVRVVDAAGRPVADAELAIGAAPAGALDVFAVTGADGCRHIGLARGRYHLRATALGEARWYRDAGDRSAADALDVGDAGVAITLTLRAAGADGPDAPPSAAAADGRDAASDTAGGRWRKSRRGAHGAAGAAPLGLHQSGGAVTAVAYDPAGDVVWAVVGPRVTAWRLDADGWRPIGASAVLPSVPESIAVGDGRVVVGVRERGGAALWVLDGTQPTEPPITARVPLDRSGPTTIGAVAVGGALAWAVTDRGVSVVDLKGSVPTESGFVTTADRRTAAMDALDWQGGVAVTADRHIAVVVRPWGLWIVDAVDPYRPRVRSMPGSRPSEQAWPAFAVAARGHEAVVVDVAAAGPGLARIVDVRAPDRPVVVAARDLGETTAALAAAGAHPRDDPRDGRSRGPAVAWHGDHVVFVAADGTRWAALRRSDGLQGAATGGPLAAWAASRAAVAMAASDADPPGRPTLAVAAGDAGLVGVVDGARHAAPSIAPPIWQSVVGADGRHLLGAAGPAGLAVVDVASDGVAARAPWALARAGVPCGAVMAVAAAGGGVDVALTADCGLVTLAIDAVGRPSVLGALPWSTAPPSTAGAQAVPFAAAAHRAAWIEHPPGAEAAIVVADVRRPAQPVVVNVLAAGTGVPTGLGLSADTVWAVVVNPLGQAALWRWPVDVIGAAPTPWAELDRAHRVIDAAPGALRLSWPLGGAAVAAVGDQQPPAAVPSRSGSGFGRVAPATTPLGRSIWLASNGRQLDALDRVSNLATTGASLDLPHGQLVDAWATAPQRDDVHLVGRDVVVSLGDAGVVRLADAVARIGSDDAVAERSGPIYLPAVHAERDGAGRPRVVVLLDGTASAAGWFAANGGGDALAAAVGAWHQALPRHAFLGATWGGWAERTGPLAPNAAALVARIAAAPAADRRADAALALALEALDRPGAEGMRSIAGDDVVVLIAAGDSAPNSVAGAEARARVLQSRGAALVVVLLGEHPSARGLERIARAGGSAVRAVANAPALAAAVGGRSDAP